MSKAKVVHAHLEFLNSEQVRQAIYADLVVGRGMQLAKTAPPPVSVGHYTYVPGYTAQGPVCVGWGRQQQVSWAWLETHYGEACTVLDVKDGFTETTIEEARLNAFVARIPADC